MAKYGRHSGKFGTVYQYATSVREETLLANGAGGSDAWCSSIEMVQLWGLSTLTWYLWCSLVWHGISDGTVA